MIFVFEIVSVGSDLHREPIEIQDECQETARRRAESRLADTFSLASAERKAKTSLRFVAAYPSRRALEEATSWAAQ